MVVGADHRLLEQREGDPVKGVDWGQSEGGLASPWREVIQQTQVVVEEEGEEEHRWMVGGEKALGSSRAVAESRAGLEASAPARQHAAPSCFCSSSRCRLL